MLNVTRHSGICLLLILASCDSNVQPQNGIVLGEPFGNVQNGSAYDRASLDITKYNKLVLPASATINRNGEPGILEVYMEKTLGFCGHPPESMSITDARNNMGCACRADGDSLMVATYGEWDSHIEGGAGMRLLFVVPESVEIETDASLSGENSRGREWYGAYLTKPKNVDNGYWYGPASPATGWNAIPDVPDTDLTLREEAR